MKNTETVMIVDDAPEHIAFAGAILRNAGYKVIAATSGETALNILTKTIPDLIVLDINMSGMNGLDVCRKIREDKQLGEIPIIFLTEEKSSDIIAEGFCAGCSDYVTKPFVKAEYLARISTHLKIARHQKELLESYNELNMFCSAVSHDLKSPLNVMNMLIKEMEKELSEKNDDYEIQLGELLSLVDDKSITLIKMIERLLDFSRMCNIKPLIKKLDLKDIISNVFNELTILQSGRKISLKIHDMHDIKGDEVLIKQLVENIISNSIKFTKHKKNAIIEVKSAKENNYTVISIKDNGIGFDMTYKDALFKIFSRLHDDIEYEGNGVGLVLIDSIMKRHGGYVDISSVINEGTEIKLYFKDNM